MALDLNKLSTGGWIVFGLMVLFDTKLLYETFVFVYRAIAVARGHRMKEYEISFLLPVIFTVWFLYLIS